VILPLTNATTDLGAPTSHLVHTHCADIGNISPPFASQFIPRSYRGSTTADSNPNDNRHRFVQTVSEKSWPPSTSALLLPKPARAPFLPPSNPTPKTTGHKIMTRSTTFSFLLAATRVLAHGNDWEVRAPHPAPTPTPTPTLLVRQNPYPTGPAYDVPSPISLISATNINYSQNTLPIMATYTAGAPASLSGAPPLPERTRPHTSRVVNADFIYLYILFNRPQPPSTPPTTRRPTRSPPSTRPKSKRGCPR
jgi:hypothetical protein